MARDMVEDYVYLAEHAGIETAERFLSSADESFSDLQVVAILHGRRDVEQLLKNRL